MNGQNWSIQKIILSANTLVDRINTENIIYTNPSSVLQQIRTLIADIPEQYIIYKIPMNMLTLGHVMYMKKGEYKKICEWRQNGNDNGNCNDTNYIVLVAQTVKLV